MMGWNRNFLFNWVIFRFHVSLFMTLTPKGIPTLFQDLLPYLYRVLISTQVDDSRSLHERWVEITKHPLKNGCAGYQTRIFFQCSFQAIKTPKPSSVVCGTGSVSYLPRLGKEHSGTTTPITAMQGIRGFCKSKLIINHLEPK